MRWDEVIRRILHAPFPRGEKAGMEEEMAARPYAVVGRWGTISWARRCICSV
jgi:hypothetical protein